MSAVIDPKQNPYKLEGSVMSFEIICDVIPLCCTSPNPEQLPVQCVDDPVGLNAVIITGDQEFPMPRMLQGEDNYEAKD